MRYRNFKCFETGKSNKDLKKEFPRADIDLCIKFNDIFLIVLNKHTPLKKKMLRANHAPHVSKISWSENVYFKK